MWEALKLVLPAIIPSWNFFDVIVPSPRIQYLLLDPENNLKTEWKEFRPRPQHLSVWKMIVRMFWNPVWNESLFIMSCAERLIEHPSQHSEDEIFKRIKADIIANKKIYNLNETTQIQFRLVFIRREGDVLKEKIEFQSRHQTVIGDIAK